MFTRFLSHKSIGWRTRFVGAFLFKSTPVPFPPPPAYTESQNCVHSDSKLWLIFEWVDQDLKRYMNSCKSNLEPMLIKVGQRTGCRREKRASDMIAFCGSLLSGWGVDPVR